MRCWWFLIKDTKIVLPKFIFYLTLVFFLLLHCECPWDYKRNNFPTFILENGSIC